MSFNDSKGSTTFLSDQGQFILPMDDLDLNGTYTQESNEQRLIMMTVHCQRKKNGMDNKRKILSKCGKFIYHIYIIDYLQPFRVNKRAEIMLRRTFQNAKASDISAMPPTKYAERFLHFFKNDVLIDTLITD